MTKVLRLLGYWDGRTAPEGLPDVCGFVSAADPATHHAVAAYLRSGTAFAVAAGVSVCRLCGAANGSAELTDGEHFVWPEGLAHYVEAHGVRLPDEVVAVAGHGVAPGVELEWFTPALLETGEVTVDTQWWSRQAGPGSAGRAVRHLLGCARNPMLASWELPTRAAVYVDRVPRPAVATLARLRRLLGTAWPFADLRDLLGTQPFLAADGNPAELYRALTTAADLRPYLFYDTGDGLRPIWSGG
ncbi:hypothetical protein ACQP1P_20535 [Dactylosporangium sp. CA-052675]|uniref:hypothetical protein n=1 Tax=Dactylosporangium sp. CA-052675 TaxID=3239927 RepID=UPI003D8BDEA1